MADEEKVIKVILAHPEMTRTDKAIVIVGWLALIGYVLMPIKPRKRPRG